MDEQDVQVFIEGAENFFHQMGGEAWSAWNERLIRVLPEHQERTGDLAGSWSVELLIPWPTMDLDTVYTWLSDHLPPSGSSAALVHNDYKLDNAMFAATDPGWLVAVFDWYMATLGEPLSDLGALLAYWAEDDDPSEVRAFSPMPADVSGFPTRDELVARYAATSGSDVDHIDYYHVLALFRLAVILAQIHIRWIRGQTRDERFAGLDELVRLVAARAAWIAGSHRV